MTLRERIWRIARGEPDPLVTLGRVAVAPPAEFPAALTDPSAAEFVAQQEAWIAWYDEHDPAAAEGMRRAALGDAHAFLARFGDSRPARRPEEP